MHACIPLVIEEEHSEERINCGLVRIGERSLHLVQAEARHQRRLIGNLMVHTDGELICARHHFRRGRIRPQPERSVRLVRERIPVEHGDDFCAYGNG